MQNNDTQQFEILDILVIISFAMQINSYNKAREEYNYLHEHLESIENKLDKLLKGGTYES